MKITAKKKKMLETHVAVFLLFFHFLVLDLGRAARSVLFALSGRNRVALQQTPRHEHIGDSPSSFLSPSIYFAASP